MNFRGFCIFICFIWAFAVGYFSGVGDTETRMKDDYKKGQIDAINGKVKYKMVTENRWIEKEDR